MNTLDFILEALSALNLSGKITIEKKEGNLEVKVSANTDNPVTLGVMFMEAMTKIAEKGEKYEIAIMSACEETLDEIGKGGKHE